MVHLIQALGCLLAAWLLPFVQCLNTITSPFFELVGCDDVGINEDIAGARMLARNAVATINGIYFDATINDGWMSYGSEAHLRANLVMLFFGCEAEFRDEQDFRLPPECLDRLQQVKGK